MCCTSSPVAEDYEVEGEYGHVDGDWPDDEAEDPSKEMLD